MEGLQQQQQEHQKGKEVRTGRSRKKKRIEKVKTATLSSLERDILLFFLSRKVKRLNLREILEEFQNHQPHTVLRSVMRLCDYGILLLLNDLTVVLDNIPLLLQILLHFKYNTSAYMLYFLFRQNIHAMREGRPVFFNYKTIHIAKYRENDRYILYIYSIYHSRKTKRIWDAIDELKRYGILKRIRAKYVYEVNYNILPQELLSYILSIGLN